MLRRLAFYTKGEFTEIAYKDDCNPVSFVEYAYAMKTTQPTVPRIFQEAMKISDVDLWREAAEKEIKSLQDLNVYKLVPRSTVPPGQKVIGTNWVFKVKAKQVYKARLVVQGWNQVPEQDCGSTFAQVCRLQSVQMVLAIAAEMDCEVRQLDVKTAFLYAHIEKEVLWLNHQASRRTTMKRVCW